MKICGYIHRFDECAQEMLRVTFLGLNAYLDIPLNQEIATGETAEAFRDITTRLEREAFAAEWDKTG